MRRTINNPEFKKLVDLLGPRGLMKLAYEAKCGHSTVEQMYRDAYHPKSGPGDSLCERITGAFAKLLKMKIKEDDLFPVATTAEGEAS
jgi:hypothetical protein